MAQDDTPNTAEARLMELEKENKLLRRTIQRMRFDLDSLVVGLRQAERIRDRNAREKELQDTYNQLFLANCPQLIIVLDRDLRYVTGTENLNACLGLPAHRRAKGEDLESLFSRTAASPEWTNGLIRECRLAMAGKEARSTSESVSYQQGTALHVTIQIAPVLDKDGECLGVAIIQNDVTELTLARDKAEAGTRAKGEFLANMSHEIRTPMNAVIGMAYLALKAGLPPRQRGYVTKIHTAATSLLGIINDILDFSKIEAGKMRLESSPFMLEAMMGSLRDLFTEKCAEKGLDLTFFTTPDVPPQLVGDSLRLSQVLTNLVANAIKFTEQGRIQVGCSLRRREKERVELLFTVRDSGIGMTEEELGRLFQAFTQADASTTRKFGGTGLGLTISKLLVGMMQGDIRVESVHGRGTTMRFTCVLKADARAAVPNRQKPEALRGQRILLVSPNPVARAVTSRMLRDFSLDVAAYDTIEGAWMALLEADRETPFPLLLLELPEDEILRLYDIWNGPGGAALIHPPAVVMSGSACGPGSGFGGELCFGEGRPAVTLPSSPGRSDLLNGLLAAAQSVKTGAGADDKPGGDEAAPAHPPGHGFAEVPQFPGRRLLLVEDNVINQEIAREILEDAAFSVAIAGNGQEALSLLEAPDCPAFDMVLMDLQMPVMDGYEATRRIRANPRYSDLPIIAMTAHALSEERDRCLALGMNGHIAKPIEVVKLYETLQEWFGRETVEETA